MPNVIAINSAARPSAGPDFSALIAEMQHAAGAVLAPREFEEKPIYGQTLYLAHCSVDLRYGLFRAYVFQDIIDKHYIIASPTATSSTPGRSTPVCTPRASRAKPCSAAIAIAASSSTARSS